MSGKWLRDGWVAALPLACWALASACAEEQRPGALDDIPLHPLRTDDASRPATLWTPEPAAAVPASDAGAPPFSGDAGASQMFTRIYDTQCDADSRAQWGFFIYDTTTPADSTVRFRIRTANTGAALETAPWIELATAQASPNTQRCAMSGPAPCPLDLYVLLGGVNSPAVHHALAELEVTLLAASDHAELPSIEGWQLTYSCPVIR